MITEQHSFPQRVSNKSSTMTFPFCTRPECFSLLLIKICADLQWVEACITKSLVSSCFRQQERVLDIFSSTQITTSEIFMYSQCRYHCVGKKKQKKKGYCAILSYAKMATMVLAAQEYKSLQPIQTPIKGSVTSAQSSAERKVVPDRQRSLQLQKENDGQRKN